MDPRVLFKAVPAATPRPVETSPAIHLAKLRYFKKTGGSEANLRKYEDAVNRMWRNRYIRLYDEEVEDGLGSD